MPILFLARHSRTAANPKSESRNPREGRARRCAQNAQLLERKDLKPLFTTQQACAGGNFPKRSHLVTLHTQLAPCQAMMSSIGCPWSISRRLRPGTSSLRESRPSCLRIVAWMSVT